MKIILRILYIFIAFAVGATFIYSAYTKVLPIQGFEYTIVEFTHMPWLLAALLARTLVGLEAALGLLIIVHFFGNGKWVLKTALALLIVFSTYLIYLWAKAGNNVNCGCFGDKIWMSPSASLIKNAVLMLLILVLIRFHKGFSFKWSWLVDAILFVAVIAIAFILYPIPGKEPDWLLKDHYKMDLTALYEPAAQNPPTEDLSKGKHIIAYFSLGCPHCRMAARKMHVMKENNPSLPFYMILTGSDVNFKPFFKETHATNIPYTRIAEEPFKRAVTKEVNGMYQISVPQLDWVQDGWVEAETNYITLDQGEVEKWLKK